MISFKINNLINCFKSLMILTGIVFVISLSSQAALAQPAPSACDPEYMDAMETRAWMEAQREIAQNHNLIAKPDSVLEYTCFDRILGELASDADIFSETTNWGVIPPQLPGSMVLALNSLFATGVTNYLSLNFPHGYIDDRIGIDSNMPPVVVGNSNYSCAEMGRVWNRQRCLDFWDENRDEFYTFDEYVGWDPRELIHGVTPIQCAPPANFGTFFDIAYNGQRTPYEVVNNNDAAPYNEDPVLTFIANLTPGACTAAIQTGVTVQRINFAPASYADAICSNPGCYHNAGGGCSP
jgi:hypothetical protein